MCIAKGQWSDSRPLVSAILSMLGLTGDLPGYPVVVLCRGGPGALGTDPSHAPVGHRWGECWGGLIITLILDLDSGRVGKSTRSSLSSPPECALLHYSC